MSVRALWLPYEVVDVAAAAAFYTDHLGLSSVDSWSRDGEVGVVLRVAGAAYVELASVGAGAPAPVAFELADRAAVDAVHARLERTQPGAPGRNSGHASFKPSVPHRFPRGHYGFDAPTPTGRVMVWSER